MNEHQPDGNQDQKATILEMAKSREKADYADGKCSKCGARVPRGNFCDQCGATFLTPEQIEKGELIFE